jgi:capsular exopolysaccharide synthesis family protein
MSHDPEKFVLTKAGNLFSATTPNTEVEGVGLKEIFGIIWRRKWQVLFITLLLVALIGAALWKVAPRFSSKAMIMIQPSHDSLGSVSATASSPGVDAETIATEIEVLRSPELARKTIEALNLDKDPDFIKAAMGEQVKAQENGLSGIAYRIRREAPGINADQQFPTIINSGSDGEGQQQYQSELRWSRLTNAFLSYLEVTAKKESRVISIQFTSKNPLIAADVPNTIIDLYLKQQTNSKLDETKRATEWLNQQVADLQQQVKTSETAVEEFRKNSGMVHGKDGVLLLQQISEVSSQLILAKTQRSEANARFQNVQSRTHNLGGTDSANEVLQSELIQKLRSEEADIQRKLAELSTEYGRKHPKMLNLSAELSTLQAKIQGEVGKVVNGLANESSISNSRVAMLQKNLDDLKTQVVANNSENVQLNALEREAEANRNLLNTFTARFKETSTQEDLKALQPDAKVISHADIEAEATFPKKKPMFIVGVVGSGIIALMVAFLLEYFIPGIRSTEQAERLLSLPALGIVPLVKGSAGKSPTNYITEQPKSALVEAINSLRWNLGIQSNPNNPNKVFLITSTKAKEGKTTTAVCLAKMIALAGKKVILIDADAYGQGIRLLFGLSESPGLVDLFSKEDVLSDVIWTDPKTGIDIIRNGKRSASSSDHLASKEFSELLADLKGRYDAVIIDSPAIMTASDALILAKKVDATVFVTKWASTKQEAIQWALKKLISTQGNVAGILLSMVDTKKYASYSYGDSGIYKEII